MKCFSLSVTKLTYLIAALVIIFSFLTHQVDMYWIFNSDSVYLSALFIDVFKQGHHFSSWHLTPAPYFFPDMLVSFLINIFVGSVYYVFLLFAVIQTWLTLFLISKIIELATNNKNAVLFSHIIFLLALAFLATQNIFPYCFLMVSAFHFGTFITGLILLACLIGYFEGEKLKYCVALIVMAAIGSASDLFFLVWFIGPIITSMIFIRILGCKPGYSVKKISALLIAGCLIGVTLKYSVTIDVTKGYISTVPHFSWGRVQEFTLVVRKIFLDKPLASILIVIFYVLLLVQFFPHLLYRRKAQYSNLEMCILFLNIFIIFSTVFSIANIMVNSFYHIRLDKQAFRYIINVYWFPVVFAWLPIYFLFKRESLSTPLKLWLYITMALILIEKDSLPIDYHEVYYPDSVQCIDAGIHEYNSTHLEKINYGIAGYWQAKLVTVFSKEGLVSLSFTPNLIPDLVITTPEIYRSVYDFAIIDYRPGYQLNKASIEKMNGKPVAQFSCKDAKGILSVMIYGKNKLTVK